MTPAAPSGAPVAILVKGYPRLSETFIAQEMLALEQAGIALEIWSLRQPTDGKLHDLHRRIAAPVRYLPEYLYQAPLRVIAAAVASLRQPGFPRLMRIFMRDLRRDPTPNRLRRLGQAFVFARELAASVRHIHVHYLHTPASVARYAAILTGRRFSFSAHAKDIWTTPDWEKAEKIADASWGVTCTCYGAAELARVTLPADRERLTLVYHGLDLSRFPPPPQRPARSGRSPGDAVEILSVGRAVAKKGYGDLLKALSRVPEDVHWRFVHVGSGELAKSLEVEARRLSIADRVTWRGGLAQSEVVEAMRSADLFVLPCKEGGAGDRDGLPNVIMEAATQALAILSTRFAGVPEFVRDGIDGVLVPPDDVDALSQALERLLRDPDLRRSLGQSALDRVRTAFSFEAGIATLVSKFDEALADAA